MLTLELLTYLGDEIKSYVPQPYNKSFKKLILKKDLYICLETKMGQNSYFQNVDLQKKDSKLGKILSSKRFIFLDALTLLTSFASFKKIFLISYQFTMLVLNSEGFVAIQYGGHSLAGEAMITFREDNRHSNSLYAFMS